MLVAVNFFFLLYWTVQVKRQMLPSLVVLLFGYFVLGTFFKLGSGDDSLSEGDLEVMSYNIHGFNEFGWTERDSIYSKIQSFVKNEQPDIVCFQEIGITTQPDFLDYPYHYLEKITTAYKVHLGIYSKYPIVGAKTINFPNSINNGSYADIAYKGDTLRIYNVHMQSLGITPGTGVLRKESSERLYKKVVRRFKRQEEQAEMIRKLIATNPHPTLLCGDFNNTQFSKEYHLMKGDMQDSFIEAGSGYGSTFKFLGIPMRIDFILADDSFEVQDHKNYDMNYSDHYPIMASFRMKKQ